MDRSPVSDEYREKTCLRFFEWKPVIGWSIDYLDHYQLHRFQTKISMILIEFKSWVISIRTLDKTTFFLTSTENSRTDSTLQEHYCCCLLASWSGWPSSSLPEWVGGDTSTLKWDRECAWGFVAAERVNSTGTFVRDITGWSWIWLVTACAQGRRERTALRRALADRARIKLTIDNRGCLLSVKKGRRRKFPEL